jgi:hypothetical protein
MHHCIKYTDNDNKHYNVKPHEVEAPELCTTIQTTNTNTNSVKCTTASNILNIPIA